MKKYVAILFLLGGCSHYLPDFAARLSNRNPTNDRAEVIGEYSLGCLMGAKTFSGKEKGLLLSQTKRGRYWGHPDLIELLTQAGEHFHKQNKKIIVGDLSMSRGGPTITGHNSHQNGLDVDVWFKMPNLSDDISFSTLETEEMKPVENLEDDQIKLIKFFANDSKVERIFINAGFKKKLCESTAHLKLTIEEQRKLRPWWGHDDHIHVRLVCPSDSKNCVAQKPIPPGDGCGEELNWWFSEDAKSELKNLTWEDLKGIYLEKIKKLPSNCSFYQETF